MIAASEFAAGAIAWGPVGLVVGMIVGIGLGVELASRHAPRFVPPTRVRPYDWADEQITNN